MKRPLKTAACGGALLLICQTMIAHAAEPTLEETQQWISKNFGWKTSWTWQCYKEHGDYTMTEVWESRGLTWNGCKVTWQTTHTDAANPGDQCDKSIPGRRPRMKTTHLTYSVNLADLDPEVMSSRALDDYYRLITLWAVDSEYRIEAYEQIGVQVRKLTFKGAEFVVKNLDGTGSYADGTERMRKAFGHAIRLCGGKHKREPF